MKYQYQNSFREEEVKAISKTKEEERTDAQRTKNGNNSLLRLWLKQNEKSVFSLDSLRMTDTFVCFKNITE